MSERKPAEGAKALHDPQVDLARWQAVLDTARDAIISIDPSGCITLFNRAAEAIFGYAADEVMGKNVGLLMLSPYREEHDGYLETYQRTGNPKAIGRIRYVEARRKTGETFPIELSVSETRVGKEVLYTAIIRDVTGRKEVEEARARLAAIVESTNVAIVGKSFDGRITAWNLGAERLYGYSADEVLGRDVSLLIPEGRREELHQMQLRVQRGDHVTHYHTVRLSKGGNAVEVLLDLSPIRGREGEIVGISSIAYDVSDLKRAERRVAAQYAVTRLLSSAASLAEAAPGVVSAIAEVADWEIGELWYADFDSGVLRLSGLWHPPGLGAKEFERVTRENGSTGAEGLCGRVWKSGRPLWIEDISALAGMKRAVARRLGVQYFVEELASLSEAERAAAAHRLGLRSFFAFPIPGSGRTTGVLSFFARKVAEPEPFVLSLLETLGHQIGDFIERKRGEEAIRESEARFHAFMDNSPSAAFLKDEAGRYLYANCTFERMFRVPRDEIWGKTDRDLLPADIAARVRANDLAVLTENRPVELTEAMPVPDGGQREWMVFKFPITEANGRRLLGGIAIDVTERRRSEERLRELERLAQRRERLADIGGITAKIAHDIGNPLTGLSIQTRLMLNRARREPDQPLSSAVTGLEQFQSEISRLESLTRSFLSFARDQRLELSETDLLGLLREVHRLWQPVATARNIDLTLDAAPDVPRPKIDAVQLRRVFDNLVKNALEAIDGRSGEVKIVLDVPDREKVRVSVADSGVGIPEGFEVFGLFETTKPEGSGLGLALARQIVLAHGGDIRFERRVPRGTVFHVDLPLMIS